MMEHDGMTLVWQSCGACLCGAFVDSSMSWNESVSDSKDRKVKENTHSWATSGEHWDFCISQWAILIIINIQDLLRKRSCLLTNCFCGTWTAASLQTPLLSCLGCGFSSFQSPELYDQAPVPSLFWQTVRSVMSRGDAMLWSDKLSESVQMSSCFQMHSPFDVMEADDNIWLLAQGEM